MMRERWTAMIFVLVAWCVASPAPAAAGQAAGGEQYSGMWSGTYDGSGTGPFEMTLGKNQDGAIPGKVNVTTDGGSYSADLKSVSFDGAKMSARYDFPLAPEAEVVMTVTFDGKNAKGTWSLRPKGATDEIAAGGLAIEKK
jgi:hypothetical protein